MYKMKKWKVHLLNVFDTLSIIRYSGITHGFQFSLGVHTGTYKPANVLLGEQLQMP